MPVPEETLSLLVGLLSNCDAPPWVAIVEGRDQSSGDSFIQTSNGHGEDLYITRDSGPANKAYLDLIASAITHLPELIQEVRDGRGA